MSFRTIKCEAIDVKTETGVCPGIARTKKGEVHLIDGRTPCGEGMCSNAFSALSNPIFVMMCTDEMPGEKDGYVDRVCPHGAVTFRLSRSTETRDRSFLKP